VANCTGMEENLREMPELELALLRRGVDALGASSEQCGRCGRRPLIGERVYAHPRLVVICELCAQHDGAHGEAHVVHGPEFGHTIRLIDRRSGRPRPRRPESGPRAPAVA
jgi:hypothetical protein